MPEIIASTYEIVKQIGSGGGGIVYLGRHLRLGKWVVLKADRRTISAKPETLRREVDALKNLSHTYIPQVYDFVVEGETVYTVMDYIEGESLDKPLRRGERFSQAQVIQWAMELLEALCYLHSRPPHGILHSDIKPSNIMRTPQNDICLIDFNIALALGEEGAVRVGFSRGYASPEHYGVDYSDMNVTQRGEDDVLTRLPTERPETVVSGASSQSGSTGSGRRTVLLDVRSDIYSLGATLYHLFTGRRPAQDAKEVEPISPDELSPAVAAIIHKAMDPDPGRRWQTAQEMLQAFERLHDDDPRMKRHRLRCRVTAAVLTVTFLAGGLAAFTGLKQMERTQNAYALAEYSAAALAAGNVPVAVAQAMGALPLKRGLFDPPYTAQAQRALANALGVYDLSDGFKAYLTIQLDSAPLKVVLSPKGTRVAVLTDGSFHIFDTDSGQEVAELPAERSALSDAVFLSESRILYAGADGIQAYDISSGKAVWSGKAATGITLSADRSTAAAVYKDENVAAIYDTATGEAEEAVTFHEKRQSVTVNDTFADPEDALFALNGDGTWLAASFSDGGLRLFNLLDSEDDLILYDNSAYTHFEGGFFGDYFAFSATGGGESVFAVIDLVNSAQTGGFAAQTPFHVFADESGIYLSSDNILVQMDPVTGEQREVGYTGADITVFSLDADYTMAAADDGTFSLFDRDARLMDTHARQSDFVALAGEYAVSANRDIPVLQILRLETHPEAQAAVYDADYLHSEARFSADGETVMLFRYDAFRICTPDGSVVADVEIPDAEQVYDQQFRRENGGSYLEVIYNDGRVLCYSAADGTLLSETKGEAPDPEMFEVFFTDNLRITSPLHGTPAAYDRESGELVRELEPDAYLTYVTQVGDYVITEYVSAQGQRFALLLDGQCRTLADLPDLCDITADGLLVFDDMRGNLRQSRIYSIQELLALGDTQQGGNQA